MLCVRSPCSTAAITRLTSLIGSTTAFMVALIPSMMARNSPWCLAASARVSSLPCCAAPDSALASATSVWIVRLICCIDAIRLVLSPDFNSIRLDRSPTAICLAMSAATPGSPPSCFIVLRKT